MSVAAALARCGAFLVEPRVLRRVVRRHRGLSGLGLQVLHGASYTLPRAALLEIAAADELGVGAGDLPEEPILLPRPDAMPQTATPFWRPIFHARVHQALERRDLSLAVIRDRVHRIGQTEFDEIRFVLRQDDLLLPPRDGRETYMEFCATWLELRIFAPRERERLFTTFGNPAAVDATLALDVDRDALLLASRPDGAPDTPPAEEPERPAAALVPAPAAVQALAPAAAAARARGNLARAAVLACRAGDEPGARRDLGELAARVRLEPAEEWIAALLPLARAAAVSPRRRTVEMRLLYDLVKAATDREREMSEVRVADWLLAFGRRPLVRPLPFARQVRSTRDIRRAVAKLGALRIPEEERAPLAHLLHLALDRADEEVRALLRPPLEAALDEVGLVPRNVPERVARAKLVAELLDRAIKLGFLGLGDLRDAVSRNGLKLHDLAGPRELFLGDQLLRADRLLDRKLVGVYRRGEIYLRFLQKLSSLFFGTPPGRFLTLYAILPALAAFVTLEGLQHLIGPIVHKLAGYHPELASPPTYAAVGVVYFALLHSSFVRRSFGAAARGIGRVLRAIFVGAPAAFWNAAAVKAFVRSRPVRLLTRHVLKPACLAALVALVAAAFRLDHRTLLIAGGALFVVFNVVLSTRAGATAEEIAFDWLVHAGRTIGRRVLPGLFRLILDVFRTLLEALDRALYAVDEMLRFRKGDRREAMILKGILGTVWAFVTYLVRIYINLLIEPTVNPIKHFPVVTVSGKIMLPLTRKVLMGLRVSLTPVLGGVAASSIAGAVVIGLPGLAGFLVWELKENWRLYERNRPPRLHAVVVGSHGETVGRLLRPGLHSGTIPKTYAKLRRAAWKGSHRAAKHRETLHHVEEALALFVERELVALLRQPGGLSRPLVVRHVAVASNRVRIALAPEGSRDAAAEIAFEDQSGWLLAGLVARGFAADLPDAERETFAAALAGLYKLAGVDLVREQVVACLPRPAPYDISDEGLVVWPAGWTSEVVYRLDRDAEVLAPHPRGDALAETPPPLPAERLIFPRQDVTWDAWVERWSGHERGPLVAGPPLL